VRVSILCMEFGLVGIYCGCSCGSGSVTLLILLAFLLLVYFQIRTQQFIRIEFPLPSIRQQIVEHTPLNMMVSGHTDAKRCAYCHEEFESVFDRRFCVSCGSAAHEECAVLNGGCSVYGCAERAVS
jgi:hypothetical protein